MENSKTKTAPSACLLAGSRGTVFLNEKFQSDALFLPNILFLRRERYHTLTHLYIFDTLCGYCTRLARQVSFMAQSTIRKEGIVLENLPNTQFRVELEEDKRIILVYLSGKMRVHFIRILPGDKVTVELAEENSEKGRIVYRTK